MLLYLLTFAKFLELLLFLGKSKIKINTFYNINTKQIYHIDSKTNCAKFKYFSIFNNFN